MKRNLAVAGVALLLVTSVVGGSMVLGGNSASEANQTNSSSSAAQPPAAQMNVENVQIVNRSDGVITAEVKFNGTINKSKIKHKLSTLFAERKINISTITIT